MPQPATTGHTWAVVGQTEEPALDENARPTSLHHVTFKTNTGHTSTVTIPDREFNARNVAKAVAAKATEINRVHVLTSSSPVVEAE